MSRRRPGRAAARAPLAGLGLLLGLQCVLLSLAVEGFLGGRPGSLLPFTVVSGACLAGAFLLLRAMEEA
jgi:hypothetical protein